MTQNPAPHSPNYMDNSESGGQLDLRVYLGVLLKYKYAILGLGLLAALIGLYFAIKAVPIYSATSKLQIEREANYLGMADRYGYSIYDWQFYNTQYELIRSWGVAELAAGKLGYLDDIQVNNTSPKTEGFSWRDLVPDFLRPKQIQLSEEEIRSNIIKGVQGSIQVQPVEDSQLVAIQIYDTDPQMAATKANAVAESYIEFLKDKDLESLETDQRWISSRLDQAKQEYDEAQANLQAFLEQQDLIQTNQGIDALKSQSLQTAIQGQTTARVQRQSLERVYQDITNARNGAGSLETITALETRGVVRELKSALVQARQQISEYAQRYGPKHPRMIEARSVEDSAGNAYQQELERVADSVVNDYRNARANENTFSAQVNSAESEIRDLNRNRAQYQRLEDSVASAKSIYEKLQSGGRTTDIIGSDGQNINVSVIEYAHPRYSPVRPDKQRMVMIAAIVGLMLGVGLAFLLDHLDNTFKDAGDVEQRLAMPVLGVLPKLKQTKEDRLAPMREFRDVGKSSFSEAVRTIRTGVMLSALDREQSVIMVTSSVPGEGKTTLSMNMAYAIGQMKKTLLIDADMRRPMVGRAHQFEYGRPGLASYMSGEARFEECVTTIEDSDLTVMHAGSVPPNPLELLASKRFQQVMDALRSVYDYIVVDCAPALAVSDALVVSRLADAVLYVVRADATPFQAASEGVRRLRRADAPLLGVVLNHVAAKGSRYYGKYGRYGYYNSSYYHDYYGTYEKTS